MESSSGGGDPRRNHLQQQHQQQQQQPWMSTGSSYHHHQEYSLWWPPRSYTCSFCKREFRSAQALGGHMNVHRRDRARLRQYSPPWPDPHPFCTNPNPNPNPNPNVPNLNLSPPPPVIPTSTASELSKQLSPPPVAPYTFTSLPSPLDRVGPKAGSSSKAFSVGPFQSRSCSELKSMRAVKHVALVRGEEFEAGIVEEDQQVRRSRKKTTWIGREISSVEEGLDLELRLGYT